jgi:hypothetical protein
MIDDLLGHPNDVEEKTLPTSCSTPDHLTLFEAGHESSSSAFETRQRPEW